MASRHVTQPKPASDRTSRALRTSLLLVAALGIRAFLIVHPVSGSLPAGIYVRVPRQLHPRLALICLPPRLARLGFERGYLSHGLCSGAISAVLKPVVATAGDQVRIERRGVTVNGCLLPNSAPQRHDHLGRPLSVPSPSTFEVQPGEIFALSSYTPASWDGRYWGTVPVSSVRAWLQPLFLNEPLPALPGPCRPPGSAALDQGDPSAANTPGPSFARDADLHGVHMPGLLPALASPCARRAHGFTPVAP